MSEGVDADKAADSAVREHAILGLGGCNPPHSSEEAVAVDLDLSAMVKAEDDEGGIKLRGWQLPGNAVLPDLVEVAALLVLECLDDSPAGERGVGLGEERGRGVGAREGEGLGDEGVTEELAHFVATLNWY